MKKKIVSALLCVAMIATMVTGCGGSKSSSTSGNADSTAKQFEINAAIAANPPALDPHTVNANVTGAIGIHMKLCSRWMRIMNHSQYLQSLMR